MLSGCCDLFFGCKIAVHCRTGSLENPLLSLIGCLSVHCRTGNVKYSHYAFFIVRKRKKQHGSTIIMGL